MIKWYLVLYILGGGSSVNTIPTPYKDKMSCKEAAKNWDGSEIYGSGIYSYRHVCIKSFVDNDKGYVCQPNATECQVVK